ncbi:DUF2577 family protein [Marinicrinis sediminis]|uniref:DUF2577 family protein n=1 Tax=Marinicrinis sediminis TaxID=1652465 RepID=A0ABW5R8F2_9BACL
MIETSKSGASQLVQLIRSLGKNIDVRLELATVKSPPPQLSIQIDHLRFILDQEDLIVAEHLLEHRLELLYEGSTQSQFATVRTVLSPGDRVLVASHSNDQQYIILDKVVKV